jgi:hypothetical protein
MDITKSHWQADANRVSLSMPINKIDKENRLVSGFATLDNVDTSDDVVTAEASKGAFERFRGNIREMHQPIAAGRMVDFREEEFFYDGKFYRGIYATAYVSKGAEDTWQKVLDGTLSGFSIGGNITQQVSKFVKDAGDNGKTVRYIEKYDLIELSLVDSPANPLANLDSIVKVFSIKEDSHGDKVMKGMVMDTNLVNVFWCDNDEIAKNSTQESESCLSCGNAMKQIGWFEQGEDNAVKTAAAVATFLRQKEAGTDKAEAIGEGGVQMANENEEKKDEGVVTSESTEENKDENKSDDLKADQANADEPSTLAPDEVTEQEPGTRAPEDEAKGEEILREAEELHEASPEPNFEKMFDDLKASVNSSIEGANEKVQKAVKQVEEHVENISKSFEDKTSEIERRLSELSDGLQSVKTEREGVAKRLDALEKTTAIKKSGEVETEPEKKMQKGLWAGTFFGEND